MGQVVRVALLQMAGAGYDQAANAAKGEEFCRKASELGADIALFPEMWNNGYSFYAVETRQGEAEWLASTVEEAGEYVGRFRGLAKELRLAIGLTYLERWQPRPRNSFALIDREGETRLRYAKVHTCAFDRESALTPGEDFYVSEIETARGPVKVGAMICFDREFPESARVLMLKGAELILTPNACTLEENRLGQFRARAFENMVGVAMANYAIPQENGHSAAFSPVAFDENGVGLDTKLVEAGEAEGVFLADFDMEAIRELRRREVWGNAYRRPASYGILTDKRVEPPFDRKG